MRTIQLTKGKVAIVDDCDYEYLSQWKWLYSDGYAERKIRINEKSKHIRMHQYILFAPDGMEVDHKNRSRLDNRRDNLRICTHSQNEANRSIFPNNISGKKGVSWDKVNKKWRAVIEYNYKYIHIGRYKDINDASEAYNRKAKELFGEFAYVEAI
jgi:hypothetical protein